MIAAWRDKRLLSGVSPRTVNLDLIVLRAVFRKCLEDGTYRSKPDGQAREIGRAEVSGEEIFSTRTAKESFR